MRGMPEAPMLLMMLPFVLPLQALASCNATAAAADSRGDAKDALALKLVAIALILTAGAAGVLLPILGRSFSALRPESNVFFTVKAFAAGVILATGMVHILPAAFDALASSEQGGAQSFPFAGFIAMAAALATMTIDSLAAGYYRRSHFRKARPVDDGDAGGAGEGDAEHAGHVHMHTHATHGHAHGEAVATPAPAVEEAATASNTIRHRVVSQVLELGILAHSVIIGVSLGTSETPSTIRPLVGALSFHQFFEGIGLGGCIVQANFRRRATVLMAAFFSVTTPIGVALGIGISSSYGRSGSTATVVEGAFNSASAGILIYMALVDLLAADFQHPRMQSDVKLQLAAHSALFLGAGFMSLLANWA